MNPVFLIISWAILGVICSRLAEKRGKNPIKWFFIGSLFGVLAILWLLLTHRSVKQTETVEKEPDPLPSPAAPVLGYWYYLDQENQQFGPMSFAALRQDFLDKKISEENYIWTEDWEDWKQIKDALPGCLENSRDSSTVCQLAETES